MEAEQQIAELKAARAVEREALEAALEASRAETAKVEAGLNRAVDDHGAVCKLLHASRAETAAANARAVDLGSCLSEQNGVNDTLRARIAEIEGARTLYDEQLNEDRVSAVRALRELRERVERLAPDWCEHARGMDHRMPAGPAIRQCAEELLEALRG